MAYLRKKHLGSASTTTCDVERWCSERSQDPEGDHEPYVPAFSVAHENRSFRVVMTTKHLLRSLSGSKVIQVDATYKVNWNGYPVIVAVIADTNKAFYPCVISVVASEAAEDYAFVMRALKKGALTHSGMELAPEVVVADMARAITAAVAEVFPGAVRRVCWFHLKRAVEERARKETRDIREVVLNDLTNLQLSPSLELFHHAAVLMMEKWSRHGQGLSSVPTSETLYWLRTAPSTQVLILDRPAPTMVWRQ